MRDNAPAGRSDSDEDSSVDDDLAAALFYGFAEGATYWQYCSMFGCGSVGKLHTLRPYGSVAEADSAKHVIDLATIADKKLRRHSFLSNR